MMKKIIIEIGKLLIIIWFLFLTLLEIGSLFFIFLNFIRNWFISAETLYSSLRLVFRCVKQYIN